MKLRKIFLALLLLSTAPAGAWAAPSASQYQPNDAYDQLATIAVSGTTSGAIDMRGVDLAGVFIPAEFDGTTLTITASTSLTGTYVTVQDGAGSTLTLTTTASRYMPISNLALVSGLRYIKLVAGTSQTTTDTVFTLALRPL